MSGTNKPELVILRGLQASGKTTWARMWVAADRAHRARVNKDDLRSMFDDGVFVKGVTEDRILAARDVLVKGLMLRGLSVVVDDTNLAAFHVTKLARMAHAAAWEWRVQDFTDVPLEECIARDAKREGRQYIGATAIRGTYMQFLNGRHLPLRVSEGAELEARVEGASNPYVPLQDAPEAVLVDVDGTVALKGTRSPFDETRVHEDAPNAAVIEAIQGEKALGRYVVFMSGRTAGCYAETWAWLHEHLGFVPDDLLMRPAGDMRQDALVKRELFDEHVRDYWDIRRVYDDRDQVVKMWRDLGLTVLQVAEGAF